MTVTAEYAAYTNSGASAQFSKVAGSPYGDIEAKVDAWLASISSNASLTAIGHSTTKEKSYTGVGAGAGFVYRFDRTDITPTYGNSSVFTGFYFDGDDTNSSSAGTSWSSGSSNGGNGSWSSSSNNHFTTDTWNSSTSATSVHEYIITYDDVDGQEFFLVGNKSGSSSTTYQQQWGVIRASDGHWIFMCGNQALAWDSPIEYWTGVTGSQDTDPTLYFNLGTTGISPFLLRANASTGGPGPLVQVAWYAANTAIYLARSSSGRFGAYATDGSDQIIELSSNACAIRYAI